MGADVKALKMRIKSVDSTLHLTKAMGLVASSKIRRATDGMLKSREYADSVENILAALSSSGECRKSPYMRVRQVGEAAVIVIAGDRGMAGGYNANVFRLTAQLENAVFFPIGKRACDKLGGGFPSAESFGFSDAAALAGELCAAFADGRYREVGIVSTRYVSMLSQEAEYHKLLPLEPARAERGGGTVFEPNAEEVFAAAVPEYVAGKIIGAVKESFASEIAARKTAMDNAGRNASEMIEDLRLRYNRARQGAITQEITEIVAGSGK